MATSLQDAEILFPLSRQEIIAHVHREMLVDVAFRCPHGVEVYCFDPFALDSFHWHGFMHRIFRWATTFGVRPISMIGNSLPRRGYDLEQDFEAWLLDFNDGEGVMALF